MVNTFKCSFLISCLTVGTTLASEAAADGGESASIASKIFAGYFGESIWTLAWFFLLLIVLGKIAWKPILNSLQARENHITNQIKAAEDTKKAAEVTLGEYKQKLAQADAEGKDLASQHMSQAQAKAQQLLEKARLDAESIRLRAKEDIDKAKDMAQKSLLKEAGDMVFDLGSHILARNISAADNQKLIEEAVSKYRQKKQLS